MNTRPALHQSDVVLVPFPFADLTGTKLRPAVVVSSDPQEPELILAFITSVMANRSPRGAEVAILQDDPEFELAGLKTDSLIRLDKLVTLSRAIIHRQLGSLGPQTRERIKMMLPRAFEAPAAS